MKIHKSHFLALSLAAAFVVLSTGAHADQLNEMGNSTTSTTSMSAENIKDNASSFFSNIGNAFKSGLQTVGNTTGKVIQSAGKGLQDISGVNEKSTNERIVSPTLSSNEVLLEKAPTVSTSNANNSKYEPMSANEKVVYGSDKEGTANKINAIRAKATKSKVDDRITNTLF